MTPTRIFGALLALGFLFFAGVCARNLTTDTSSLFVTVDFLGVIICLDGITVFLVLMLAPVPSASLNRR
jgi:hypothetical protein